MEKMNLTRECYMYEFSVYVRIGVGSALEGIKNYSQKR